MGVELQQHQSFRAISINKKVKCLTHPLILFHAGKTDKHSSQSWQWGGLLILLVLLGGTSQPSSAQTTPYRFPPQPEPTLPSQEDPLNPALFDPDPLLPSHPTLTPLQRRRIKENLDQLEQEAAVLNQAGETDADFKLWYRTLRARRRLGALDEIQALGRVGKVAWEQNRKADVNIINTRLRELQAELDAQQALTPDMLTAIATAYQQMHQLDDMIALYEGVRVDAQRNQNIRTENQALEILGELYLAKFDYPNAAAVYEILLERSRLAQNTYYEGIYLQKLAYIYQQAVQPANAIRINQQLQQRYLQEGKALQIAEVQITIGDDYRALGEAEQTSQTYQTAYATALPLQQFRVAAIALDKLGDLYQESEQPNFALDIYKRLLEIEQQSYNYYGMMRTYEKIANLYLAAGQTNAALTALQQALALARSLNYSVKETALLNQMEVLTAPPTN